MRLWYLMHMPSEKTLKSLQIVHLFAGQNLCCYLIQSKEVDEGSNQNSDLQLIWIGQQKR